MASAGLWEGLGPALPVLKTVLAEHNPHAHPERVSASLALYVLPAACYL